jgi:hypothetical protein
MYKSNAGTSVCSESSSYPFVLENEIITCGDDATLRIDEQLELKVFNIPNKIGFVPYKFIL